MRWGICIKGRLSKGESKYEDKAGDFYYIKDDFFHKFKSRSVLEHDRKMWKMMCM